MASDNISMMLKNQVARFGVSDWGLLWVLWFSVVYQKWVPIGFLLLGIGAMLQPRPKAEWRFKDLLQGPSIWLMAYFIWLLIAMLWTENQGYGWQKVENKLTFLLLPILVFVTKFNVNRKQLTWVFLAALFSTLLYCEIVAVQRTICCADANPLFYFQDIVFVNFMHRSYYSAFLQIGILLLCFDFFKTKKWTLIFPIAFLLVGNLQTLSKAGMLCMAIVFVGIAFYSLFHAKLPKKLLLALGVSGVLGGYFLWNYTLLPYRLEALAEAMQHVQLQNNPSTESNTSRILCWHASLLLIQENGALGSGTGDYNQDLVQKHQSLGNTGVAKEQLNSHNQFLNTAVQLGWFGAFILLAVFLTAWQCARSNFFDVLLVLTYFLHFLFESYLETQAGVVLFAYFLTVFFNPRFLPKSTQEIIPS